MAAFHLCNRFASRNDFIPREKNLSKRFEQQIDEITRSMLLT